MFENALLLTITLPCNGSGPGSLKVNLQPSVLDFIEKVSRYSCSMPLWWISKETRPEKMDIGGRNQYLGEAGPGRCTIVKCFSVSRVFYFYPSHESNITFIQFDIRIASPP